MIGYPAWWWVSQYPDEIGRMIGWIPPISSETFSIPMIFERFQGVSKDSHEIHTTKVKSANQYTVLYIYIYNHPLDCHTAPHFGHFDWRQKEESDPHDLTKPYLGAAKLNTKQKPWCSVLDVPICQYLMILGIQSAYHIFKYIWFDGLLNIMDSWVDIPTYSRSTGWRIMFHGPFINDFPIFKTSIQHGGFSSQPCLIPGGYPRSRQTKCPLQQKKHTIPAPSPTSGGTQSVPLGSAVEGFRRSQGSNESRLIRIWWMDGIYCIIPYPKIWHLTTQRTS